MTTRSRVALGTQVTEYLDHRRSLGFGLVANEVILRDFVRFAEADGPTVIAGRSPPSSSSGGRPATPSILRATKPSGSLWAEASRGTSRPVFENL